MKRLIQRSIGATLAIATACAAEIEWPQYKGNAGATGVSPDDSIKPPLKLLWSYRMDGDASFDAGSGVIVGGGRVYANVWIAGALIALDAKTGDLLWEFGGEKLDYLMAPAYADGRLVVWARNRIRSTSAIVVLNAADASVIWRRELRGAGVDPSRASLPVHDGRIYVCEGGPQPAVSALSLANGETIWRTDVAPGHGIYTVTPTVAGGRVFAATRVNNRYTRSKEESATLRGALTAFDAATGAILWTRTDIYPLRTVTADSEVVVCPMAYAPDTHSYLLEAGTGKTIWTGPARFHYAPATLTADQVLIKPWGPMLYAHDRRTGEPQWAFDSKTKSGCCTPSISGHYAYIGSGVTNGNLEALWAFQLTHAPRESGIGGTLHAVDLRTGESVWRFGTGNTICGEPAIAYGRLYVSSRDGRIYCFAPATEADAKLPEAKDASPPAPPGKIAALLTEENGEASDAEWPMQGRDASRTSRSPGRLADALQPAWKLETGGRIVTSPVVKEGRAFVGSLSGKLIGAKLASGKPLWTHDLGAPIRCSPAAAGDLVYCGSDNGTFVALSATDGRTRWTFRAGAAIQASPAVSGGVIVFGAHDHNIYALDRHTGRTLWKFRGRGAFVQAPPVIADGRVYAAQWHDWVWALDATTGQALWKSFVPVTLEAVSRHRDRLYVRSPFYVLEIDPATGKRLRLGEASYSYGGIGFGENQIFQSGVKGEYGTTGLTRLDLDAPTLEPAKYPTIDDVPRFAPQQISKRIESMSTPLVIGARVCIAGRDGRLVVADFAGKVLWEHNLGARCHGTPIAADEMLLVGADDGQLHAFRSAAAP